MSDEHAVYFCTGNSEKFATASDTCASHGLQIVQAKIETTEIQSENPEDVAVDKARKAYAEIKKPIVITDDAWLFHGLNGFPGVYMHSMNLWFTPEDFLRLTLPLTDRRVTITQHLVFFDGTQPKVFKKDTHGTVLKEIRGSSDHPSHTIVTLDGDDGLSRAEIFEKTANKTSLHTAQIWHTFAEWYTSSTSS